MTPLVSATKRKGRTTWEPERSRLASGQSGDGGVRGDDTVGLDAHRLRVSLAILAKRPQTIAARGVARSPSVNVGRRCARADHSGEETRRRGVRREGDLLVVVGVVEADHRLIAVNTLLRQSPRCTMRSGRPGPSIRRN